MFGADGLIRLAMLVVATAGAASPAFAGERCHAPGGALSVAGDYNVFVTGTFDSARTDVEGRIAVGGDATFASHGIGSTVQEPATTLSVGGTLRASSSQVYGGDARVAGPCLVDPDVGLPSGQLSCNDSGAFVAQDHASEIDAISHALSELPTGGETSTSPWGAVTMTGSDPALNVFELDLEDLRFADWVWRGWISSVRFDVPAGSTVVVDVLGDPSPLFRNGGFMLQGAHASRIIWNLRHQTELDIRNVAVPGSIVAPHAHVRFDNGAIDGTLVAASAEGTGEYHDVPFDSDLCLTEPVVLVSTFGDDDDFSASSSHGATSPPRGNPPADNDVAAGFAVPEDNAYTLATVELAVTWWTGVNELDVYLMGDRMPATPNPTGIPHEPDDATVLEHWRLSDEVIRDVPGPVGPEGILRLDSTVRPVLEAGTTYWVVISVPEPNTYMPWWIGGLDHGSITLTGERNSSLGVGWRITEWADDRGQTLRVRGTPILR